MGASSSLPGSSGKAEAMPPEFLGEWSLERNENFDDFLAERGVSWFYRKLIIASGLKRTLEPLESSPTGFRHCAYTRRGTNCGDFEGLGRRAPMTQMNGEPSDVLYEKTPTGDVKETISHPSGEVTRKLYSMEKGSLVHTYLDAEDKVKCRQFFKRLPTKDAK